MFDLEETQEIVQKAIQAVRDFEADTTIENAREADYRLSIMRLAVKSFDYLHWFVAAEKEIHKVLDQQEKQSLSGIHVEGETLVL